MNKYSFIHPSKCGGKTIEEWINKNELSNIFLYDWHNIMCETTNNPIIILRDPVERFKSLFRFWKRGTNIHSRSDTFIEKHKNINIKDFINMIIQKDDELYGLSNWQKHFSTQTTWIPKETYSSTIVIIYSRKILNEKFFNLLQDLNIDISDKSKLPLTNISIKMNNDDELDEDDLNWIKEYYKSDFELLELIYTKKDLFKAVY